MNFLKRLLVFPYLAPVTLFFICLYMITWLIGGPIDQLNFVAKARDFLLESVVDWADS